MLVSFVAVIAAAALGGAHSSVSGTEPSATFDDVAPAATTVPADASDAELALLNSEVVQVTDAVVEDLVTNNETAEYADLFAFADSNITTESAPRRRLAHRSSRCKTAPGDLSWPTIMLWNLFDSLLGNALQEIVPIGSPCYPESEYDNYDQARCEEVVNRFTDASLHYEDSGSTMFPLYTGMTCMPKLNATTADMCTQGGFADYSVKVSNVAQVQLSINMARSLNLRLVVRNTGHDYSGRSIGKGALSLWTHGLKELKFVKNYKDSYYQGAAFQVGAGVQGHELLAAAETNGVSVLTGICPTVGIFGGYSTGGGHGPLMQMFGMGADQIVSMNVVTASGRFITVTPSIHSDLYWAMLGGGGGTFGVVTSAVVKAHPKIPVTTSIFSIASSADVSVETFWAGVKAFWDEKPRYNAAKTYSTYTILNTGHGYVFSVSPFFATNKTVAEFESLTKPFFDKLKMLKIPYKIQNNHYDSVYPAYQATYSTQKGGEGTTTGTPANRLVPKSNWDDPQLNNKTFAAVRYAVDHAIMVLGYHQAPNNPAKIINSVNPAFRKEAAQLVIINSMPDNSPAGLARGQADLTNNIMRPLREATLNGGAYGNEADPSEPNYQQSFWGANYARLVQIKNQWDPTGLFYVNRGVGTEGWVVEDGDRGLQTQDGKLCRR
jgi:hypothetical protein